MFSLTITIWICSALGLVMNIMGGIIYTYVKQIEKSYPKRPSRSLESGVGETDPKFKRNSKVALITYEENERNRTVWQICSEGMQYGVWSLRFATLWWKFTFILNWLKLKFKIYDETSSFMYANQSLYWQNFMISISWSSILIIIYYIIFKVYHSCFLKLL